MYAAKLTQMNIRRIYAGSHEINGQITGLRKILGNAGQENFVYKERGICFSAAKAGVSSNNFTALARARVLHVSSASAD